MPTAMNVPVVAASARLNTTTGAVGVVASIEKDSARVALQRAEGGAFPVATAAVVPASTNGGDAAMRQGTPASSPPRAVAWSGAVAAGSPANRPHKRLHPPAHPPPDPRDVIVVDGTSADAESAAAAAAGGIAPPAAANETPSPAVEEGRGAAAGGGGPARRGSKRTYRHHHHHHRHGGVGGGVGFGFGFGGGSPSAGKGGGGGGGAPSPRGGVGGMMSGGFHDRQYRHEVHLSYGSTAPSSPPPPTSSAATASATGGSGAAAATAAASPTSQSSSPQNRRRAPSELSSSTDGGVGGAVAVAGIAHFALPPPPPPPPPNDAPTGPTTLVEGENRVRLTFPLQMEAEAPSAKAEVQALSQPTVGVDGPPPAGDSGAATPSAAPALTPPAWWGYPLATIENDASPPPLASAQDDVAAGRMREEAKAAAMSTDAGGGEGSKRGDVILCIDVDGPFVAVKDVRRPLSPAGTGGGSPDAALPRVEFFLSRRKRKRDGSGNAGGNNHNNTNTTSGMATSSSAPAVGGGVAPFSTAVTDPTSRALESSSAPPAATRGRWRSAGGGGSGIAGGRGDLSPDDRGKRRRNKGGGRGGLDNCSREEEEERGYDTDDENDEDLVGGLARSKADAAAMAKAARLLGAAAAAAAARYDDFFFEQDEGYHPPEPLPRRQMRVLHKGDRIVLRVVPQGNESAPPPSRVPPLTMKFEYRQHRVGNDAALPSEESAQLSTGGQREAAPMQAPVAAGPDRRKVAAAEGMGGGRKARLLSVKPSAESRLPLNSTSAAEASMTATTSVKVLAPAPATSPAVHMRAALSSRGRSPGDIASSDGVSTNAAVVAAAAVAAAAVAAASDAARADAGGGAGVPSAPTPRGVSPPDANNNDAAAAGAGGGEDDDDMEEYSYLTGEVIMKDQGYVSAITGDEETDMDAAAGRKKIRLVEAANRAYGFDVAAGGESSKSSGRRRGPGAVDAGEDEATDSAVVLDTGVDMKKSGGAVAGPLLDGNELKRPPDACSKEAKGQKLIEDTGNHTDKRHGAREKRVSIKSDHESADENFLPESGGVGLLRETKDSALQNQTDTAQIEEDGAKKSGAALVVVSEGVNEEINVSAANEGIFFTAQSQEDHDEGHDADDEQVVVKGHHGENVGGSNIKDLTTSRDESHKRDASKTMKEAPAAERQAPETAKAVLAAPSSDLKEGDQRVEREEGGIDSANEEELGEATQAYVMPQTAAADAELLSQSISGECNENASESETTTAFGQEYEADAGSEREEFEQPTQPFPSVRMAKLPLSENVRATDKKSYSRSGDGSGDEVFHADTQLDALSDIRKASPRHAKDTTADHVRETSERNGSRSGDGSGDEVFNANTQLDAPSDIRNASPGHVKDKTADDSSISSVSSCALLDDDNQAQDRHKTLSAQWEKRGSDSMGEKQACKGGDEVNVTPRVERREDKHLTGIRDDIADESETEDENEVHPAPEPRARAKQGTAVKGDQSLQDGSKEPVKVVVGLLAATAQKAPIANHETQLARVPPSTAQASPKRESKKITEQRRGKETPEANRNAFIISSLQNESEGNGVVHRVSSGAMMTGPVGGATMDLGRCGKMGMMTSRTPPPVRLDRLPLRMMEKDLLTSIALLSNERSGNTAQPAASSEETTVCQMSASEFAKDQGSTSLYLKGNSVGGSIGDDVPPFAVELSGRNTLRSSSVNKKSDKPEASARATKSKDTSAYPKQLSPSQLRSRKGEVNAASPTETRDAENIRAPMAEVKENGVIAKKVVVAEEEKDVKRDKGIPSEISFTMDRHEDGEEQINTSQQQAPASNEVATEPRLPESKDETETSAFAQTTSVEQQQIDTGKTDTFVKEGQQEEQVVQDVSVPEQQKELDNVAISTTTRKRKKQSSPKQASPLGDDASKPPASVTKKRKRKESRTKAAVPGDGEHIDEVLSSVDKVRVMFTGVKVTSRHKKMIKSIGAELVEKIDDAPSATHVIAVDGSAPLRRTPKLMICLCRTSNILKEEWLTESSSSERALGCDDFLVLDDKEAEETYNFSMRETLQNGESVRCERGGVLGGWSVYFCKNVAGNKAPSAHELNLIVSAAGGRVLKTISAAATKGLDPSKIIIITSDPASPAQNSERDVSRVTRLGGKSFTTTWLFHSMITQHLSVEGEIDQDKPAVSVDKQRAPRRKRKAPTPAKSESEAKGRRSKRKR